jgi:DNA-binding SARP family transcriptional activator
MIELRTLGGLDVGGSHGETLGPLSAQPKRLALLTYLALADGSSFRRRDAVVAHLWPELDTAHARGSLRQALHFLRRSLGDGVILSRGEEEIAVNRALLWCDAATFEANCEAGQCRDALHLYRGDFLDGFFVSDVAAEFDQWMAETRAHLRRRAAGCAWGESDESRARGDITNAVSLRAVLAGSRGDWGRALALFQFAWDRGQPGFDEAHFDPVLEQLRGYPPIRALIYANR